MASINIPTDIAIESAIRLQSAGEDYLAETLYGLAVYGALGFSMVDTLRTAYLSGHKIATIKILRTLIPGSSLRLSKRFLDNLSDSVGHVTESGETRYYTTPLH